MPAIASLQTSCRQAVLASACICLLLFVPAHAPAQAQQKAVGKEAPGKAVPTAGRTGKQQQRPARPAASFAPTPWQVQCASNTSGKVACALGRAIVERRSRQILLRVSIPGDRQRMVLQLPHGLDLRKAPEVLVDDKSIGKAAYFTSRPQGAFAEMPLKPQQLATLRKGKRLEVRTQVLAGRALTMRMGLKGFAAALQKLR